MMRRGVALLPTLWVVVVMGGLVLASQATQVDATVAARNRIQLLRADWARKGCLNVMRAQLAIARREEGQSSADKRLRILRALARERLPLDSAVACESTVSDLNMTVNVNTIELDQLACMVRSHQAAAQIVERRPYPTAEAVETTLRELGVAAPIEWFETTGENRLNINAAPPELLGCLPVVGRGAIVGIRLARRAAKEFYAPTDFLEWVGARRPDLAKEPWDTRQLVVQPTDILVSITGTSGDPTVQSTMRIVVNINGTSVDVQASEIR